MTLLKASEWNLLYKYKYALEEAISTNTERDFLLKKNCDISVS